MTDGKPVDSSTPRVGPADRAARREAAKERARAQALKANLRRRKAPPASDPDPA